MRKIIICGGHLKPSLVALDALKGKNLDIVFFGRKVVTEGSKNPSAEFKEVTSRNIKFVDIKTGRLQRNFSRYTIPSLFKIPFGFVQSFIYLVVERPRLVVSFGGSISFPVVFAAWLLKIPAISHEQAVVPGLSNRLNSHFVKKMFLTFEETKKYLKGDKVEVIGNLIRNKQSTKLDPKLSLFLRAEKQLILVSGGNQGSHFINKIIFENFKLFDSFNLLHQVGTANFKEDHAKAASIKNPNYLWVPYLANEQMETIFKQAYIVISRSGANTVWDLAQAAKIAILIPLPHTAGSEQEENAKLLEAAGSAIVISQQEANGRSLGEALERIKKNYQKYQKSASELSKSLPENATKIFTDYILKQV